MKPLRIHWCLPRGRGNTRASEKDIATELDLEGMIAFSQEAETLGVDSLLMGIGFHLPDPLPLLGALAGETTRVKFLLAYRPGLLSPTLFSQVVNTVSWIADKRISLNIVAGISPEEQAYYGDFLPHDDRYRRADEFMSLLHRFWQGESPISCDGDFYKLEGARLSLPFKGGGRPEIYISGASEIAQQAAVQWGDCWLRYGDTPEGIARASASVRASGRRIGVRMHVLARATREAALAEITAMMANPDEQHRLGVKEFVARCDSVSVKESFRLAASADNDWLSPTLWSGAVAYRGGPALCVVGSYDEVAQYLMAYKRAGVDEFIFSGWPTRAEMHEFYKHVHPRIRALEAQEERAHAEAST
ncbi:LLM class flavin-dependent oxidoreductase [Trinickia violacea]|uniref:LLM class flavin-dependent oxidoreductase n=1 Tax=Trinickia violacea TaxID=2571746 RepID=A0A4V1EIP8_9BURK|nr:LLM class flavin-dependent oxidoreductase [Trinickia violacea]QCP54520.1 LLM class flavin-dependent oxidoreductase [Trinickia violacea]